LGQSDGYLLLPHQQISDRLRQTTNPSLQQTNHLKSWKHAEFQSLIKTLKLSKLSHSQVVVLFCAANDCKVAESLVKIYRDCQVLPQPIKRIESSKYTLKEAHDEKLRSR